MADPRAQRESLLRREYHAQTARICWHDLQTHYARGSVIAVSPALDLVDVAVQLAQDNTGAFQAWIESGEVSAVTELQAMGWFEENTEFWAVVAAPWVLIAPRPL